MGVCLHFIGGKGRLDLGQSCNWERRSSHSSQPRQGHVRCHVGCTETWFLSNFITFTSSHLVSCCCSVRLFTPNPRTTRSSCECQTSSQMPGSALFPSRFPQSSANTSFLHLPPHVLCNSPLLPGLFSIQFRELPEAGVSLTHVCPAHCQAGLSLCKSRHN